MSCWRGIFSHLAKNQGLGRKIWYSWRCSYILQKRVIFHVETMQTNQMAEFIKKNKTLCVASLISKHLASYILSK